MKGKSLTVLLFAFALAPTCLAANEKILRYEITDLGTLGGVASQACGINNRAEVTGFSSVAAGLRHAFFWRDGAMTDLGTLPTDFSSVGNAINNSGQVAGHSAMSKDIPIKPPFHAVVWDDDEIISLGTLGVLDNVSFAINGRGQVTGGAITPVAELHAFLWEEESGMTDLGTLSGDTWSIGHGINNRGQVVGMSAPGQPAHSFGECTNPPISTTAGSPQRPVLWGGDGTIIDLGTLGGKFGVAKSINERGVVVGAASTAGEQQHAALWHEGKIRDLGTLGGVYSGAHQINQRGDQVVGVATTATGEPHAFLWPESRMTDLNNLIPRGSGWILTEATAINKAGKIAGWGSIGGQRHGFLLTPDRDDD
jgi:probable HAF family extracellular repeat protein